MSKRVLFTNTTNLLLLQQRTRDTGGNLQLLQQRMKQWPIDESYESRDELAELDSINTEFIQRYAGAAHMPRVQAASDYWNYDLPQVCNVYRADSQVRDGNRIPYRQKQPPRWQDSSSEGLRGISHGTRRVQPAGMDELIRHVGI